MYRAVHISHLGKLSPTHVLHQIPGMNGMLSPFYCNRQFFYFDTNDITSDGFDLISEDLDDEEE